MCNWAAGKARFDRGLEVQLHAVELHGREKLAVGHLRQSVPIAADAHEALDVRIPRREVAITDEI